MKFNSKFSTQKFVFAAGMCQDRWCTGRKQLKFGINLNAPTI